MSIKDNYDGDVFKESLERLRNHPLMILALTDTSYSEVEKANNKEKTPNNFKLATYGDAVLKLAYCEILFGKDDITELKKSYECDKNLVTVIGAHYNILDRIKLNTEDSNMPTDYSWNPNKKNHDKIHKHIATCVEAIIGAIYQIDKDMDEIIEIARYWKELIDNSISESTN